MCKRLFLAVFAGLLFSLPIFGRHIIGGVINYEYKGNGKYFFTMRIYRDCKGGGAPFDGEPGDKGAIIGVFREIGGNYQAITQFEEPLKSKKPVEPPFYPCMAVPPDVCVEEGIYEWEFTIPDFPSKAAYHFVYQRCCRNNTITNIVNPQNSGATYEIVITPEAMSGESSSPVFKNFPPTVVCANAPFVFDHAAIDKDGDSLYYRFCSPLYGGGPNTGAFVTDCKIGARPDPLCPPPYDTVVFRQNFSSRYPLGSGVMTINGKTGILTGQVKQLGQYVVGICVEEYRKGKLLSKVFRDFQFNIALCNVFVDANIASDTLVGKTLVINSCGSAKVTFDNRSIDKSRISGYLWEFNILGQTQVSKELNPTIVFPGLGKYTGRLVANPGLKPCTDTADFEVNIFPGIEANFNYAYDTCVAGPVKFTDLSTTGSGQMSIWNWEFRDGGKSAVRNPEYRYKNPGEYNVRLTVKDINGCKASTTRIIRYYPVPSLVIVEPDTSQGCQPLRIKFNNLSTPIDNTYLFDWDFGDGMRSGDMSPTHIYADVGTYTVKLNLTSPLGCKTNAVFPALINVKGSPVADFAYTPEKLSNFERTATFTDKSINAYRWSWQFGMNEGGSTARDPVYTFRDTGVQEIKLIVTHPSGCTDTISKLLDVEPLLTYFLPNAFTPNFDGLNDEFKGKGNMFGMSDFTMTIWNRWGERVFETRDPNEAWNGRIDNTGSMAIDGVYVYHVTFTGPRNKPYSFKGFATLIK